MRVLKQEMKRGLKRCQDATDIIMSVYVALQKTKTTRDYQIGGDNTVCAIYQPKSVDFSVVA